MIKPVTVGRLRQVIQCKQKKHRWPTRDPPLTNSTNPTTKCSLTFKNIKVFKIRKDYLKLVSAIFYQIFIFSPNDSPSETMKNAFYFN